MTLQQPWQHIARPVDQVTGGQFNSTVTTWSHGVCAQTVFSHPAATRSSGFTHAKATKEATGQHQSVYYHIAMYLYLQALEPHTALVAITIVGCLSEVKSSHAHSQKHTQVHRQIGHLDDGLHAAEW